MLLYLSSKIMSKEFYFARMFFKILEAFFMPIYSRFVFKGTTPASFAYFNSFQITFYKIDFTHQWDMNSDHWSRRRACWPLDHHHHHGPNWMFINVKFSKNIKQNNLLGFLESPWIQQESSEITKVQLKLTSLWPAWSNAGKHSLACSMACPH